MENIVKRDEVDELRRVLAVNGLDILNYSVGHVLKAVFVTPQLVKIPDILLGVW